MNPSNHRDRARTLLVLVGILAAGAVVGILAWREWFGPRAAVRASYEDFKRALSEGRGEVAADLVTANTIELYERCRRGALDPSAIDMDQATQIEAAMVLQLRYLFSREELTSTDGRGLFVLGMDSGLVDKKTLSTVTLRDVRIEGEQASAELVSDGRPAPFRLRFRREDGAWRVDLESLFAGSEPGHAAIRRREGKTTQELSLDLMERKYGRPIPPEILEGPLK